MCARRGGYEGRREEARKGPPRANHSPTSRLLLAGAGCAHLPNAGERRGSPGHSPGGERRSAPPALPLTWAPAIPTRTDGSEAGTRLRLRLPRPSWKRTQRPEPARASPRAPADLRGNSDFGGGLGAAPRTAPPRLQAAGRALQVPPPISVAPTPRRNPVATVRAGPAPLRDRRLRPLCPAPASAPSV